MQLGQRVFRNAGRWLLPAVAFCLPAAGQPADPSATSAAGMIPIIDTHSHLSRGGRAGPAVFVSKALQALDESRVEKAIVLPPPFPPGRRFTYGVHQLAAVVRDNPGRFAFVAGGATLNPMIQDTAPDKVTPGQLQRFRDEATAIAASGAVGFGELTAEHFSSGRGDHPHESSPPDHPHLATATSPAPVVVLPMKKPLPAARPKARILVVDDLAASAETLMILLEMEGFEVKIAGEGVAALKIAEEFRPDVVLLDIGLPGMNGFEVAHRLRNQPESREALLIALTGYGEAESRNRSAQAGFDFHMTKPADLKLLLSMLADPQEARKANAKAKAH